MSDMKAGVKVTVKVIDIDAFNHKVVVSINGSEFADAEHIMKGINAVSNGLLGKLKAFDSACTLEGLDRP